MSTLNPETLDVTTFETTATELAVVSPVTPGTVCDSPWCVQTWNPPCPATTVGL